MRIFKVRCSGISQIMTNPKEKGAMLSKTCISYLEKWLKEQPEFYNRSHEIKSKYFDKGNSCEIESMEFAAKVYKWGMVSKNTERRENDFIEGECDIVLAKQIVDIKNSWSDETFPLFDEELPIKGYDSQLQGYMDLWNKEAASVVYTLMDAPEYLVEKEARFKSYEMGLEEVPAELYDQIKADMTYSNLPDSLRIKMFSVIRNDAFIKSVYERVKLCRTYIEGMVKDFLPNVAIATHDTELGTTLIEPA